MISEYLETADGVSDYLERCKCIAEEAEAIFLFGSARGGEKVFEFLSDCGLKDKVVCAVDNDAMKQGKKFHGLDIISAIEIKDRLSDYHMPIIAIASGAAHIIRKQLIDMGINEGYLHEFVFTNLQTNPTPYTYFINHMNDVEKTYDLLSDTKSREVFCNLINYKISRNASYLTGIADDERDQYFDRDLIKLHADEHFVDCGAYTGDTLEEYLKHRDSFGKYYCFEADPEVYQALEERVSKMKMTNIRVYNIGCWSGGGYWDFNAEDPGAVKLLMRLQM